MRTKEQIEKDKVEKPFFNNPASFSLVEELLLDIRDLLTK